MDGGGVNLRMEITKYLGNQHKKIKWNIIFSKYSDSQDKGGKWQWQRSLRLVLCWTQMLTDGKDLRCVDSSDFKTHGFLPRFEAKWNRAE